MLNRFFGLFRSDPSIEGQLKEFYQNCLRGNISMSDQIGCAAVLEDIISGRSNVLLSPYNRLLLWRTIDERSNTNIHGIYDSKNKIAFDAARLPVQKQLYQDVVGTNHPRPFKLGSE